MIIKTKAGDSITLYSPGDGTLRPGPGFNPSREELLEAIKAEPALLGYAVVSRCFSDMAVCRSFSQIELHQTGRITHRILIDKTTGQEYDAYHQSELYNGRVRRLRIFQVEDEDTAHPVKNVSLISSMKYWIEAVLYGQAGVFE